MTKDDSLSNIDFNFPPFQIEPNNSDLKEILICMNISFFLATIFELVTRINVPFFEFVFIPSRKRLCSTSPEFAVCCRRDGKGRKDNHIR